MFSNEDKNALKNILKKYFGDSADKQLQSFNKIIEKSIKLKDKYAYIINLYENDHSLKEIAMKLNTTVPYVRSILIKYKVYKRVKLTDRQRIEMECRIIYDYFILKLTQKQLSNKYKIAESGIRKRFIDNYYITRYLAKTMNYNIFIDIFTKKELKLFKKQLKLMRQSKYV